MNTLVFDIETVPDTDYGRQLLELPPQLPDADVASAMFALRRERTGDDFLPLPQHRVVAIACALRRGDSLTVWSLGDPQSDERELLERFFEGIERYTPELVSWNGGGFDLPVLHYRCLKHGIQAARYWEHGDQDSAFRYNNYLSRYHWRHIDLMDVLSSYSARARASLSDMATFLGLPGKLGFSGAQVWDAWQKGERVAVRRYCETDVLNTWLVFLAFERMRGNLTAEAQQREWQRVRELLAASGEPHHAEFLAKWLQTPPR
ncbi:MAG: 3'-5' exonuclease [Nevskiaceae bacterium]|jgi:predicted PolB exonuclease-like 3'-5' exonuclease|nr:3'-5' exonuclease [Nevskiaceae bacterium]